MKKLHVGTVLRRYEAQELEAEPQHRQIKRVINHPHCLRFGLIFISQNKKKTIIVK
jgi:hypothetical protein